LTRGKKVQKIAKMPLGPYRLQFPNNWGL